MKIHSALGLNYFCCVLLLLFIVVAFLLLLFIVVPVSFQTTEYMELESREVIQVCVEVERDRLVRNVSLNLTTEPGSATPNLDFSPLDTTLSFTPLVSEACVNISIANDDVVEEDMEVFIVRLESSDPAVNITMETVTVTIEDTSFVNLTFLVNAYNTFEGAAANVCVRIDGDFNRSINYSIVPDHNGKH